MKVLFDWIDDRSGLGGLLRGCLGARIPGRACFCRVWPTAIGLAFCVQLITGFVMWVYYSPSTQTAWESVYFLQHQVAGGWLLRAMHHWSAQVLLVLVGLYLVQMIATGAYRAPRELIYWSALLMMLVTLGLLLTGDLLAWDQNSCASTEVRVGFLELLPWIGGGLYRLAAGGPQFGHLTLSRFLALHVCCLSGSLLVLLLLHVLLVRRADALKAAEAEKTVPFWPNQAVLNAAAMAAVLVAILLLSVQNGISGDQRGVELGSPADTSVSFAAARPEWAFLGLYQFARLFPSGKIEILPIFVIPGLLVLVGLAMPWIARLRGGHLFNLGFTALLLVGVVRLSFICTGKDLADEEHQAALEAEAERAHRAVELARAKGIPPTGALTLMRNDPKTQGPILFEQYCLSCHNYEAPERKAITTDDPTAPQLYQYASREWIAGLLDPNQIKTPKYFGNTRFRNGNMAGYVQETLAELEADEKEDLEKVVIALSAEARLPSQRQDDEQAAKQIEEGRKLLVDYFGCTDCHRFHGQGTSGAPELTGYGSREWLAGIISDPADERFYGTGNDRMPSYFKTPDQPESNLLSISQVELLTAWLRGQQDK